MAVADNAYSRFVQFAKITLPLLALALLSTMFLFSRKINPEDAIPFAEIDVEQIAREQRLVAPKFSGVTSDGSTITVTADTALPDANNPRRMAATDVNAEIVTTTGTQIMVVSQDAIYDGEQDSMDLTGDVRLTTSTGYVLRSDMLVADLEQTGLVSPGPVTGSGPSGTLEAGRMELTAKDGSQLLVLKNGVKLVYQPIN
jgi:lipopolysaccharide export system protein LptC